VGDFPLKNMAVWAPVLVQTRRKR